MRKTSVSKLNSGNDFPIRVRLEARYMNRFLAATEEITRSLFAIAKRSKALFFCFLNRSVNDWKGQKIIPAERQM